MTTQVSYTAALSGGQTTLTFSYTEDSVTKECTLGGLTVEKAEVTITGVDTDSAEHLIYNGSGKQGYTGIPTNTNGYSGIYEVTYAGTEVGNIAYSETNTQPIQPGTYTATIKIPDSNTNYYGNTTVNFTIGKATPTISVGVTPNNSLFQMLRAAVLGNHEDTYHITATLTGVGTEKPSGTVVFKDGGTALNSGSPATVSSGGTATYDFATPLGGTHSITAEYTPAESGTGLKYNSATSEACSFDVAKADQSGFAITSVTGKKYGDAPFTLSTTGGKGTGEVTYSVPANNGVLNITGNQATIIGAGEVVVTATIAGDNNYNGASDTTTVEIAQADLSALIFPTAGNITYGNRLSTSILTGGGTAYGSFAWTDGTQVPGVGSGGTYSVTFTPTEATRKNYKSYPTTKDVELTVNQATPVVNLSTKVSREPGNRTITLTATVAKSGEGAIPTGTVTFVDKTNGNTAIAENVSLVNGVATYDWTGKEDGVYSIAVTYNGDDCYTRADSQTVSVDTTKQDQTGFAVTTPGTKTYGDAEFTLTTSGGNGTGEITYTSSDSSILSISGQTATIKKSGTVTITAEKAGDSSYNPATDSVQLTIQKKPVTFTAVDQLNVIKGSPLPNFTYTKTDLASGDEVITQPTATVNTVDTNTLGEYVITLSGAVISNGDHYAITYVNGKMTVVNQVYGITVTNGTATVDGVRVSEASEGQIITLTAANRDGYTFTGWRSNGGGTFANASASTTTFTMPASAVTITANYRVNSSDNGGSSGGSSSGGSSNSGGSNNNNQTPTVTPPVVTPPQSTVIPPSTEETQGQTPVRPTNPPTVTETPEEGAEGAPFIEGENGQQGWDVIREEVRDKFTEALEDAGVDLSGVTDANGQIDLDKLVNSPEIMEALSNLQDTLEVTVNMNGATELPAEIISLIAGKNIDLILEMEDGISWKINGNSVTGTDFENIDLNVTKDADTIPVSVINQISGEHYSMQIELSHDGEFGFEAILAINMEPKNAGYYANLFYFDEAVEELEFMCYSEIDMDGLAQLTFTHASAYTIVVSDEPMDGSAVEGSDSKEEDTNQSAEVTVSAKEPWNPTWLIILGVVIILAGIGGFIIYKKKEDSEEEK